MIKQQDLSRFASEMLEFLRKKKINSLKSLEEKVGEKFDLGEGGIEIVEEDMDGSKGYIINYKIPATGTPISIRVGYGSDPFFIWIESGDHLDEEGYQSLGPNHLGNQTQFKEIGASFIDIRNELRRLAGD